MSSGKIERLGIYGGTFSPLHNGHVRAARAFLESVELDRLLIIPTAIPPHKSEVDGATPSQRLEMLRLAFEGFDSRLEVSDLELRREGKSYTVLTLEELSRPARELVLLVGTDMFLTLDRWYRASDIFRLATIALMRREADAATGLELSRRKALYEREFSARVLELDRPPFEVSSTELRALIASGGEVRSLMPPAVFDYIARNRLYL